MNSLTVEQKYADPAVVKFWQKLAGQGLQHAEQVMIKRYLPPAGHLLDLGCGAGRAVLALEAEGYTVTGIDLSLPMLRAGQSLSAQMQASGANLLALPFADRTFSAALMLFGALQHIPKRTHRQLALAEMARVVQPGGQLLLGLDNLAPALLCYGYWLGNKIRRGINCVLRIAYSVLKNNTQYAIRNTDANLKQFAPFQHATADSTLWAERTRPLVWHMRGLARTLRWRTWPGLLDRLAFASWKEAGDVRVEQFSQPATPGKVFYHVYRPDELIEAAAAAGWVLQGYHSGRELSEGVVYPPAIRSRDKQLFFAFGKA